MIDIRTLIELRPEDLRRLNVGYSSRAKYIVVKTESPVPAISFYRAMGFEIDGIDLSYYTNEDLDQGEIAIFMKRKV